MVKITPLLSIPESELAYSVSRSSGAGGQNVNKVNTRVTLLFNVAGSPSLSGEDKERIASRLGSRLSREGILRVTSQRHRSQHANRLAAIERFAGLLREALARTPRRIRTTTPAAAQRRRLEEKKRRGALKRERAVQPEAE